MGKEDRIHQKVADQHERDYRGRESENVVTMTELRGSGFYFRFTSTIRL